MGASAKSLRTTAVSAVGTSWAAFVSGGGWDLTITASAGDVVEVGVSTSWDSPVGASFTYLDMGTIVSGSVVNWVSTGTSSHASGVFAWFQEDTADYVPAAGSVLYTVQSGDVVSGQVTFRLYGKVSAGTRALNLDSSSPAHIWAAVCDFAPSTSSLSGTPASTSYVALTGTATVSASAGDVIACTPSGVVNPGAGIVKMDAATMVSGSPVNWFSTGTSSNNGGAGAWRCTLFDYEPFGGSVLYTVQSGDVVSGQVTVRIYAACSSSSRVVDSASLFSLRKV